MTIKLTEKQIKEGWQVVRFGEITKQCKETVDRDNNPFERYVEGGHMDSENLRITRWGVFGEDYVGPAFHRIFRKGQILYGSRRTYLKKIAVADFDGITSNTTFVIEAQAPEKLIPGLLPYLMLSESFTQHSILNSKGSTNPYINWCDIAKYEFSLPPLNKQKKNYEILKKATEQLTIINKAIYSLFLIKKQLERLCFCLPSFSNNQEKKELDILSLGSICDVTTGGTPRRSEANYWNGNIPWMSSGEIHNLYINNTKEYITDEGLRNSNARILPVDSVLLAMNGQGKTRGTVAITRIELTCNQSLAAIICDKNKILPEYLFYYLSSKYEDIRKITGEGRNGLNLRLIRDFNIPFQDISKQQRLCMIFSQIIQSENNLKSKLVSINDIIYKILDTLFSPVGDML